MKRGKLKEASQRRLFLPPGLLNFSGPGDFFNICHNDKKWLDKGKAVDYTNYGHNDKKRSENPCTMDWPGISYT